MVQARGDVIAALSYPRIVVAGRADRTARRISTPPSLQTWGRCGAVQPARIGRTVAALFSYPVGPANALMQRLHDRRCGLRRVGHIATLSRRIGDEIFLAV